MAPMAPMGFQSRRIGDDAGEHLAMTRGRYGAWIYVILGFLLQVLAVTTLSMAVVEGICRALHVRFQEDPALLASVGVAVAVAIATFWNRWRVVEAFASRFCSGLMNLSLLYVPLIAWGYANWRAALKFRGE
jgi:hypothetical protein